MTYVPERGDIIWIDFQPQAGKESLKRRPALVLTPREYNRKTSLCVVCPLTSAVKGYPFEVPAPEGVILSDQIKSLDWRARNAAFKEKASGYMIEETLTKLSALLGMAE